jgi:hypothetical protein
MHAIIVFFWGVEMTDVVHFSRWVGAPTGVEGTVTYLPYERNATLCDHVLFARSGLLYYR